MRFDTCDELEGSDSFERCGGGTSQKCLSKMASLETNREGKGMKRAIKSENDARKEGKGRKRCRAQGGKRMEEEEGETWRGVRKTRADPSDGTDKKPQGGSRSRPHIRCLSDNTDYLHINIHFTFPLLGQTV